MDAPRPTRHLHGADLVWFPFEPRDFVARASQHVDDYRGLGDRLASRRHAAWNCDCYLAFAEVGAGGVAGTAVLWLGGEDLAVDLDGEGNLSGSSSSIASRAVPDSGSAGCRQGDEVQAHPE
jgi:hypothetical protein